MASSSDLVSSCLQSCRLTQDPPSSSDPGVLITVLGSPSPFYYTVSFLNAYMMESINDAVAANNGIEFVDQNLCGHNFSAMIIHGRLNFSGAQLDTTNFHQSWLGDCFERASLQRSILTETKMTGNFRGANLTEANLTNADLSAGDFTDANFTRAVIKGAKFQGAILAGAIFTEVIPAAILNTNTPNNDDSDNLASGAATPATIAASSGRQLLRAHNPPEGIEIVVWRKMMKNAQSRLAKDPNGRDFTDADRLECAYQALELEFLRMGRGRGGPSVPLLYAEDIFEANYDVNSYVLELRFDLLGPMAQQVVTDIQTNKAHLLDKTRAVDYSELMVHRAGP